MSLVAFLAYLTLVSVVVVVGAVLCAVEGYEDETGFHVVSAQSPTREWTMRWFGDVDRDDVFSGEIVSVTDDLTRRGSRAHGRKSPLPHG
jgi:hypothetical protein